MATDKTALISQAHDQMTGMGYFRLLWPLLYVMLMITHTYHELAQSKYDIEATGSVSAKPLQNGTNMLRSYLMTRQTTGIGMGVLVLLIPQIRML